MFANPFRVELFINVCLKRKIKTSRRMRISFKTKRPLIN